MTYMYIYDMNITRWRRAEINGSNDSGDQNGYKVIQMLPRSSAIEWFQGMNGRNDRAYTRLTPVLHTITTLVLHTIITPVLHRIYACLTHTHYARLKQE